MKIACIDDEVEITEKHIQKRFEEMKLAYRKVYLEGDWSDYGDCNRAIDAEIEKRVKK